MLARELIAAESGLGSEAARPHTVPASLLTCDRCATADRERPAAARCRFCAFALCSEHLAAALGPEHDVPSLGCRHVFVAVGWLARALRG